jgi:tetraacyldisaccharide 4'-kinase
VLAAELCHREFPDAVLLMDDGFQHLPLRKHLSLILDPERGNPRCLPAGPYREPRSNRSRADLVLPGEFCLETRLSLPELGDKIQMLCAIGDPDRFRRDLEGLGLKIVAEVRRGDHDALQDVSLFQGLDPAVPIVTTAKDWVKLQVRPDVRDWEIHVARQEAIVSPEEPFWRWMKEKLDGNHR